MFSFHTKDVIAFRGKHESCSCDHPSATDAMWKSLTEHGFTQASNSHKLTKRLNVYSGITLSLNMCRQDTREVAIFKKENVDLSQNLFTASLAITTPQVCNKHDTTKPHLE